MKAIFNICIIGSMVLTSFLAGTPKVSANNNPGLSGDLAVQEVTTPTPEETQVPVEETPIVETPVAETPTPEYSGTQTSPVHEKSNKDWSPALLLTTDQEFVEAGKNVKIAWKVVGDLPKEIPTDELSLEFSFPSSSTLQIFDDKVAISQDETTFIQKFAHEGKLEWDLAANAKGAFSIGLLLRYKDQIIADTSLIIEEGFTGEVIQKGGELSEPNGTIKIQIPEGSLNESIKLKVKHITSGQSDIPYVLSNNAFEITATGNDSQQNITKFNQLLKIEISYDPEQIKGDENSLSLFYYDFNEKSWIPLPSEVDPDNHILTGYTDHFSFFDFDINDFQAAMTPSLKGFQTSGFTGAATYDYPIQLPPGPGGLQPALTLSYNSNVVDSASYHSQASWVGMGWNLTTGSIDRNMNGTMTQRIQEFPEAVYGWYTADDTFSLNLNGQSWLLMQSHEIDIHTTEYKTVDESFLRIIYYRDNGNDLWKVWDKNGNVYILGDESGSSGHKAISGHDEDGEWCTLTWKWGLSEVRNTFYNSSLDNSINYNYDFKTITYPDGRYIHLAMYLKEIVYPNERYRVKFTLSEDRHDQDQYWSSTYHEDSRLREIKIEYDPDGNETTSNELIRKYVLSYDDTVILPYTEWIEQTNKTPALVSITEYGTDGTSTLPSTTFSYSDDNMHLAYASNGYGGDVHYIYEPWYASEGKDGDSIGNENENERPGWSSGRHVVGNSVSEMAVGKYLRIVLTARAHSSTTKVSFGIYDEVTHEYYNVDPATIKMIGTNKYEGFIKIPLTINHMKLFYECKDDTCVYYDINAWGVVTRYRVIQKTESANLTATEITTTYSYDGSAVNDTAHSEAVSIPNPYVKKNTEFRGNNSVRQVASDGTFTTTWFYQKDILTGRSPLSLNGYLSFADEFDSKNTNNWTFSGTQTIKRTDGDNALEMVNPINDYQNILYRNINSIVPGSDSNAILINFMVNTSTSDFVIRLDNQWTKFWGIYVGSGKIGSFYTNDNGNWTAGPDLIGNTQFTYNTWYTLMLVADGVDNHIRVWKRDDPSIIGRTTFNMSGYTGIPWKLVAYVRQGTAYLDAYLEGKVYSINQTSYQVCDMETGAGGTDCPAAITTFLYPAYKSGSIWWTYTGFKPSWVPVIEEKKIVYNGDSDFEATSITYHYAKDLQGGSQYGNVARTYFSEYNGSSFVYKKNVKSQYYPTVNSSIYLVGLPAYENTNQCPDGVCDETGTGVIGQVVYFYDGHTSYTAAPTAGILTTRKNTTRRDDSYNFYYNNEKYVYDNWGNRLSTTNYSVETMGIDTVATQGARTTSTTYDTTYNTYMISQTDAMNHPATTFSYDYRMSIPISMTDSNGATTEARYDNFGRLVKIWRPDDSESSPTNTVAYNIGGDLFWTEATQKVDESQTFRVRKFYNGMGQLIQTQQVGLTLDDEGCTGTDCASVVDYYFDSSGKLEYQSMPYAITTPAGFVTRAEVNPRVHTEYDWMGRATKVIQPDGSEVEIVYQDLTTKTYDALDNLTTNISDVWGNLVEVEPATGPGVLYAYDLTGKLVSASYAGHSTTISYDVGGRKTGMTDPDMGTWTYSYDALGNLVYQKDAKNQVTCLYYDELNRLKGKNYQGDTACPVDLGTYTVAFNYDSGTNGIGRRTSMEDASGSTSWNYDIRGRVMDENKTIDETFYHTGWSYNNADMPITVTYPDGQVVTKSYLPQMAINSITSVPEIPYVTATNYDADGRVQNRSLNNGIFIQYFDYNPWTTSGQGGRLEHTTYGTIINPTLFTDLRYTYLTNGNIDTIQNTTVDPTEKWKFIYDTLNRLTQDCLLDSNDNCQVDSINQYIYSETNGNVTTKGSLNLIYEDVNHPHAVTQYGGGRYYWYDENGSMTGRCAGSFCEGFGYDIENRMISNSIAGGRLPYVDYYYYDGDDNRVKTVVNETTTHYIGNYYEVINPGEENEVIKKYYYSGDVRIAMSDNSTIRYFVIDHLGSTTKLINVDGSQYSEMEYKAWGSDNLSSTDIGTSFRYTGQRQAEGGLYYYNARWYDPEIGRFIQADTIIPEPGNPLAWDRYAYANNNPLNYSDPSGHKRTSGCIIEGCQVTPREEEEEAQKWQMLQNKQWVESCKNGTGQACPNTGKIIGFTAGMMVGGILIYGAVESVFAQVLYAVSPPASVLCANDGDCINEIRTGTNTVYMAIKNGVTKYVGITNDFIRRKGEQRQAGYNIYPIPGLEKLSRFDAASVEQILIENLPSLDNIYNSISPNNPIYMLAKARGNEILSIINFFGRK